MKRIRSALALSFVVAGTASAQGPTLTLQDAVQLATRNNPQFLQTGTNRMRANAALRSARGQLLPQVSTSFGSSFREGRQQFFAGQPIGSTSDVISSSADISVDAQFSRQALLGTKLQRANLEAAEADITSSTAQLRMNVITQYLNVLQAQSRASFQDTLLISTQATLALAQARQQVGAANVLDVRRAEVQVGQQRVAVLRERNAVEVEKLRLFQQIGVEQPENVSLTSRFEVEEPREQLADMLTMARQGNPSIVALRSRANASDVQVAQARAAYMPSLRLSTGLSGVAQQRSNIDGVIATNRASSLNSIASCLSADSLRRAAGLGSNAAACQRFQYTAADEAFDRDANAQWPFKMNRNPLSFSASVSLPLFDGFNREQRVEEANASRNDARYRLREQELRLTADVTAAYRNLTTAYQTVRLQEQNSSTAREALALAQERFRVGANTFVDLLQSRSDFERAETDRINAIYDYHKAFAALEGAVGRPLR